MSVIQFLPSDDENPDHLRHKTPLPVHGQHYSELPARWYRIGVQYIPALVALCDYYCHPDAHAGTPEERELAARQWVDLQVYLMQGTLVNGYIMPELGNPFCEELTACLLSGSVDSAFQQTINNVTYGGDSTTIYMTGAEAETNLVYDCDPNKMYGAARQMVDLFNRIITDILQNAVASVNFTERIEYVLSAIPYVGSLPLDEMIGFVQVLTLDAYQNYLASYTESLNQEYDCDIFCMGMETCEFNLYDIAQYFGQKFWKELTDVSWRDLIEYFVQGETGGAEFVHGFHCVIAFALAAGSSATGISPKLFTALVASYFNDEDSDWQTLCYQCQHGCAIELNFAENHFNFATLPDRLATWSAGDGFRVEGSEETSTIGLGVSRAFDPLLNITRAQARMTFRWGSESTVSRPHSIEAIGGGESKETVQSINGQKGQTYVRYVDVFPDVQTGEIVIKGMAGGAGSGSYVHLSHLKLWFADGCPDEWEDYIVDP